MQGVLTMNLKRKSAWLALGLMVALVLPLSAISPLPAQEAAAAETALTDTKVPLAAAAEVTLTSTKVPLAAATSATVAVVENPYYTTVNGTPMTIDPMLTAIDGVTYASLRNLCSVLVPGAQVTWSNGTATVYKEGVLSLTAVPGQDYVIANGRYLPTAGIVARDGVLLMPLNTIVKATDATCAWDNGHLVLTTGSGGILSGDQYYNADDLYWLSRIIYAESGNQPLSGKIAVGNVVLNRVKSPRFPNSVYGVIFQRNQFSPAKNGSIKRTPNAESVMAAKLCLDGAVELNNVLWFNRAGLKSWASRNCTLVATIAQHSFYA